MHSPQSSSRLGALQARAAGFQDEKRRVIESTDIVRLIGDALALKRKGREFVGLCPFHNDHTPSMAVVPHKQIYHCFSCGAGGDALSFAMNYYKMSFREALQMLADRAGITLSPPPRYSGVSESGAWDATETDGQGGVARADLLNASATAAAFFRTILQHAEHGAAARVIIGKRAISPAMVDLFQLGAAPDRWDGLSLTVAGKRLSAAPFLAAGLFKPRSSGGEWGGNAAAHSAGHYDAFRNRLMFPIHDQIGRVVAFGARRINDADEPKYLNSSDSAIFNKSATLYGLQQATPAIRSSRVALVTEGYMDTIACHQAGLTNAVATLGTALTAGNARLLRRLCDTVVLLFDGDQAGRRAAERAIEVFFAESVDVRIATLAGRTDAKDPDELLKREGGADQLRAIIAAAIDPLELLFSGVRAGLTGAGAAGPAGKARVVDEFLTRMLDLGLEAADKIRYQFIVRRLAEIIGLDYQSVAGALAEKRAKRRPGRATALQHVGDDAGRAIEAGPRRLRPHEHVLACILVDPALIHALDDDQWRWIAPERFDGPARAVASAVHDLYVNEEPPSLQGVLVALDDPEVKRVATALAAEIDRLTDGSPERLRVHWSDRLRELGNARTLDAALPQDGAIGEAVPATDPLDRLRRLREARALIGQDQRALPRPSS